MWWMRDAIEHSLLGKINGFLIPWSANKTRAQFVKPLSLEPSLLQVGQSSRGALPLLLHAFPITSPENPQDSKNKYMYNTRTMRLAILKNAPHN